MKTRMQLLETGDTTSLSYWLNWRVFLCAIWVFISMSIGSYLIWKYEGLSSLDSRSGGTEQEKAHFLHHFESWMPCVKKIHPVYLMVYRIVAFCLLLSVLVIDFVAHGGGMIYFYTQWTLTLVTIYFGNGSILSIYGCYEHHRTSCSSMVYDVAMDAEQGLLYAPLARDKATNGSTAVKYYDHMGNIDVCKVACVSSHVFQVLYQVTAGAVMLTDSVYWICIFPFLTIKDYEPSFLTVMAHSLNAILLFGDTALNSLRFPWFRISYFLMLTGFYVIFQWVLHACVPIWWPYPFLDLSLKDAPIWYLLVAVMHMPCYGIFKLIVEVKHHILTVWLLNHNSS